MNDLWLLSFPLTWFSANYAAILKDCKSGTVLHAENEDTRLHPAGFTKLATLYEVFFAIEAGEIRRDDMVRVSRNAVETSPVNPELREGQILSVRDLIRATALMRVNDTSSVLTEVISGSEAPFKKRINITPKKLGMTRSTFQNPNKLT